MDSETLGRRIKAAMILAGVTQAELGERFREDDLGALDPGRIIRGERIAGPSRIDAFVRHLGMPREWFTEEDLGQVFGSTPTGAADGQPDQSQADFDRAEVLADIAEVHDLLERVLARLPRADQTAGGSDSD